jgi:hypothetical protein
LVEAGREVVVFEKSRSLGGRCASRRWEGCVLDHGAQFFTVRDVDFRRFIAGLGTAVRRIVAPVVDADGSVVGADSGREYHVEGNNRLGWALAEGLDVRRETLVERMNQTNGGWEVGGEGFDAVVSCVPWPQTAALLGREAGESPYERNLTAALLYDTEWAGRAREIYAVSDRSGAALAWSACENHKGGRVPDGRTLFVVQAAADFSEENWDGDRAGWSEFLRGALEARWEVDPAGFVGAFTHRWGFSRRIEAAAIGGLPRGVFVCGDSVAASRVEAVWLSGRRVAETALG